MTTFYNGTTIFLTLFRPNAADMLIQQKYEVSAMRTLVTALMPPHTLQVRAKYNAVYGVVWWKTTAMGGMQAKRDAGAGLWSRSEYSCTPPNEVVVFI